MYAVYSIGTGQAVRITVGFSMVSFLKMDLLVSLEGDPKKSLILGVGGPQTRSLSDLYHLKDTTLYLIFLCNMDA